MPEILLSTLNAKFIHAAFGLRYLLANLGELQSRAALLEFDINQRPIDVAEVILAQNPRIVGLGVYIWNVLPTTELVAILKRIRPELIIILGGPEVSFDCEQQEIVRLADHVITGEADLKFAEVCRRLLTEAGASNAPALPRIIPAELPDLAKLVLPYDLYDERDGAPGDLRGGVPGLSLYLRILPELTGCTGAGGALGALFRRDATPAGSWGAAVQVRGPYVQPEPGDQSGNSGVLSGTVAAGTFCSF